MSDPFAEVKSSDMAVRREAELVIASMLKDQKTTVADVVANIRDGDINSRWYLSRALIKAGPGIIPDLLKIVETETDADTLKYISAVFAAYGKPAVDPLIGLLSSPNATLRGLAGAALERIGEPAWEPLQEAAKTSDPMARMCAIYILQKNGIYQA